MSSLLDNLNKEQLEAVRHGAGPLLIVAGAGTGKTTVITRRIAYLIEQGLAKPDEVLALTFTEKAAGEMQDRLDLLLPLGYHDMWISTFHSFCQRILEQHGLDIGLPGDFKLLNEAGAWILIHNNLDKFNLNYYRPLGNPKKFISSLLKHFSRCKDELITPEAYLEYAQSLRLKTDQPVKTQSLRRHSEGVHPTEESLKTLKRDPSAALGMTPNEETEETEIARIEEIANAFYVYEKLLVDNNYLDFANLINCTIKLFEKRPQILKRYQNKFKYLMVDEFQDTNYAQYQLVRLLAGEAKNLVVVGDDDQSIYKFRGASVSNIMHFKDDYTSFKQITLTENYRSAQLILDLAYDFIQANNPDRLEKKLKINKQLKSQTKTKAVIEVLEGKDLIEELTFVAKKITELKLKNPTSTWNDFAVLLRSNSSAQDLLPIFEKHGIPHTFVANTGLYNKPFISALIAYFSCLDNFHDSFTLYRVLSFDEFKIPADDLALLLTNAKKKTLSLYEMLSSAVTLPQIGQETQKKIQKILHALNEHAQLAQEKSANEVFVQIIRDLKFDQLLEEDNLQNAENRELLEQFYKKVETFVAENTDKSLHYFLHLLNLEIEAGDEGQIKFDPNLGPESLKILTVHSAKGLEFEYVFVPNMVDQRFPTRARGESIEIPEALIKDILPEGDFHLQEERRLFYVAMTRAKSHLYFSWGKDYGGAKTKKPSVFLQETKLVPGEQTSQATGKVFFSGSKKDKIIYKQLPETFSFSALKAFENCPLQYKYQYYLKLPSPGSAYFSFGQTIHKVFELYLKDFRLRQNQSQQDLFAKTSTAAELGDFKSLEKLYEANWIDEWYRDKKQKEDYRKRGKELLKVFFDYSQKNPPAPKYLEKSFYLPLGNYKFTGKIDRADATNEGLEIIDYKTSEKIPKKNDKDGLDQLYVYQWAAEEFLGEKVSALKYWYLNEGKFLPEKIASESEIHELKTRLLKNIENIVETIKYDRFMEAHQNSKAHSCEFESLEKTGFKIS
jgi:DNA helicase-2/ATP-dependent DNA helicase PcrA